VCTTATASLAAGAHSITFAAGELTTANEFDANDKMFVQTSTSTDIVLDTFSADQPVEFIVKGSVSGISMTLSAQDQYASLPTSAAVTFAFTTQSDHPVAGSVTISLPSGYFTGKTSPLGVLNPSSGSAALAGCSFMSTQVLFLVCTTASAVLPAGSHSIVFYAGELVTGAVRTALSTGLMIETSSNSVSNAASSPKLDPAVILVGLEFDTADKIMNKVNGKTVRFKFTTQASLNTEGAVTVMLPPNYFTAKTSLAAALVAQSGGAALAAPCVMTVSDLKIVCQITNGPLPPGDHAIAVAAGELRNGIVHAVSPGFSISTSAEATSRPIIPPSLSVFSLYPVISLSHVMKAFTNVMMLINLQPAILIPSTGKLVFTISGAGLACTPGTPLTFTSPSGAAGTAAVSGQILTVSLSAGLFPAGSNITFQFNSVSNPSQTQGALNSVPSAAQQSDGSVLGLCTVGFYPG
jgi:hypothetical protein